MERFGRLPHAAAWRHEESKDGFEVVFFAQGEDGIRIAGETTAVEEGEPFWVGYELELDPAWADARAHGFAAGRRAVRTRPSWSPTAPARGASTAHRRRTWTGSTTSTSRRRR